MTIQTNSFVLNERSVDPPSFWPSVLPNTPTTWTHSLSYVSMFRKSVHVYVYVYVCMCVCVCVYVRMYVYMRVCIYVYMCIYVCIYECVCMCVYMYIWVCVFMYMCIYVYMSVCVYVCIYVCIYVYIYMSVYACMCVYMCVYVYACVCVIDMQTSYTERRGTGEFKRCELHTINSNYGLNGVPTANCTLNPVIPDSLLAGAHRSLIGCLNPFTQAHSNHSFPGPMRRGNIPHSTFLISRILFQPIENRKSKATMRSY